MNELNKIEETEGNTARAIHDALLKLGGKVFLGIPSEAEMNELRMERDRVRQKASERRLMRENLEFEKLKRDALRCYGK